MTTREIAAARPPRRMRTGGRLTTLLAASILAGALLGGCVSLVPGAESWPTSSKRRVEPYLFCHPGTVRVPTAGAPGALDGSGPLYRFVAFGDQRALADEEWPALMRAIADRALADERIRFMVDTGDIVNAGGNADQFLRLREILAQGPPLPYLVAVGNHELENDRNAEARRHTARFLGRVDEHGEPGRFWFRFDAGPVRFLFLDTNDWAYGEGDEAARAAREVRAEAQLRWLEGELALPVGERPLTTVVVMHNPLVQSSAKHLGQAIELWSLRHQGRTLPEMLYEGGVDLILTGHTHTYERFRLSHATPGVRPHQMEVVNVSGRPRPAFLWFGAGARRAREVTGGTDWFRQQGWRDLEGWTIEQVDFMRDEQRDQFVVVSVDAGGDLSLEVCFLEEDAPGGTECEEPTPVGGLAAP